VGLTSLAGVLLKNMSSRSVITHTRRPGLPVQMELLQPPVHPSRFASLIRHGAASRYSAPYASASVHKSVVGRWPAAIRCSSASAELSRPGTLPPPCRNGRMRGETSGLELAVAAAGPTVKFLQEGEGGRRGHKWCAVVGGTAAIRPEYFTLTANVCGGRSQRHASCEPVTTSLVSLAPCAHDRLPAILWIRSLRGPCDLSWGSSCLAKSHHKFLQHFPNPQTFCFLFETINHEHIASPPNLSFGFYTTKETVLKQPFVC